MPEELVKPEELSKYRQVASHVVSGRFLAVLEAGHTVLFPGWAGQHGERWAESRPGPLAPFPSLPAEWPGLLFQPSPGFPSNAVREVLRPGTRPSPMDKEQQSLLFLCARMGVGALCGFVACFDLTMTRSGVVLSAQGLHSASIPGILALDLCPSDTNKILTGESWPGRPRRGGRQGRCVLLSLASAGDESTFFSKGTLLGLPHFWISFGFSPGGADKNVVVFDKSSEQILATLKGHTKKVTSVVFHPSQVRGSPRHSWFLLPEPCFRGLGSWNLSPTPRLPPW